jgi:trimethylamine--corrinoid protein Co-methyltransferase
MSIGYKCKQPLNILTDAEVAQIHEGTLDVLKNCGVKFQDNEALAILGEAGCQIDKNEMLVKFPTKIIEEAMKKKPAFFFLKGRNPKYDLKFSGDEVYFTNHAAPQIIDLDTGEPRIATIKDVDKLVTIIDALEDYHACFTTAMSLSDKPVQIFREWISAETFRHTEKSTIGTALKGCPKWMIRMAEAVGETLMGATCSSSPLVCGEAQCRAIIEYTRAGHPISVQGGSAMGANAPATIARMLVVQNAEILAGMTLAQIVVPGIGMLYGSESLPMDMRSGRLATGAIEVGIVNTASAQMARYYGLPYMSLFPMTDANSPDQQCGYEKGMQLVLAALSGVNYSISGGGVEDEQFLRFEQLVIDNEMYGMVGRLLDGIKVDKEHLSVDLIKEVGPVPGSYLNKRHTINYWKKENYIPRLSSRISHPKWKEEGSKNITDLAKEKVREILKNHVPVPLAPEVDKELDNILKAVTKEKLGL